MKKVLNVGGNAKSLTMPEYFDGWQQDYLDIDPKAAPEILCDARDMYKMTAIHGKYDAVYCSHNLEHYYWHEVAIVLTGMKRALKPTGFCFVSVPNFLGVIEIAVNEKMQPFDALYKLDNGIDISVHDVVFGWIKQIMKSGNDFFAHKCGFSIETLQKQILNQFPVVISAASNMNLWAIGHFGTLDEEAKTLMPKLSPDKPIPVNMPDENGAVNTTSMPVFSGISPEV